MDNVINTIFNGIENYNTDLLVLVRLFLFIAVLDCIASIAQVLIKSVGGR